MLDQMYACLDPQEGLAAVCDASGHTERVVEPEEVARAMHAPPEDTRASVRSEILSCAELLRLRGIDFDRIDWHTIAFTVNQGLDGEPQRYRLHLPDPTVAGGGCVDDGASGNMPPEAWLIRLAQRIGATLTRVPRPSNDGCRCTTPAARPTVSNGH